MANLAVPQPLQIFEAGRAEEARSSVGRWLRENVRDYVKIYDPYFSPSELELLLDIDPEVRIFIVTCWATHRGLGVGDRLVEGLYRSQWERLSAQAAPWVCIHIIGVLSDGQSPLHSRYVITGGVGLWMGTSVGGLGLRDTDIRSMGTDEARAIEQEMVDPVLSGQVRVYKGERVEEHVFML
jgi:hypothetical protein